MYWKKEHSISANLTKNHWRSTPHQQFIKANRFSIRIIALLKRGTKTVGADDVSFLYLLKRSHALKKPVIFWPNSRKKSQSGAHTRAKSKTWCMYWKKEHSISANLTKNHWRSTPHQQFIKANRFSIRIIALLKRGTKTVGADDVSFLYLLKRSHALKKPVIFWPNSRKIKPFGSSHSRKEQNLVHVLKERTFYFSQLD